MRPHPAQAPSLQSAFSRSASSSALLATSGRPGLLSSPQGQPCSPIPLRRRPMQPFLSSLTPSRMLSSSPPSAASPSALLSTLLPTFLPFQDLPTWASTLVISAAALTATAGAVALVAWADARLRARVPALFMQPTAFNTAVLSRCPTLFQVYRPTPFLTNGHVETILASLYRARPEVKYRREFLRASDGGVVTLDWEHFEDGEEDLPADAPVLILLPGLTGGSGCSYVLHAVRRARRHGVRAVVFNSRGTADSPVLTPQFYSASFTGDMRLVAQHVQQQRPRSLLLAAGWSLGANILMRYLGEQGEATPIRAAVSMCNPFNLTISNRHFEMGFNKIYDRNLANGLKKIFEKHDKAFRGAKGGARPDLVPSCVTVRDFDDALTIHTFGWPSVDAYYAGSSSSLSVPLIRIPLLCVQALDDPIAPEEAIPYAELQANPNTVLVCTPTGGHLGWVSGPGGLKGEPWTDQVMAEWLDSVMLEFRNQSDSNGNGSSNNSNSASNGAHAGQAESPALREAVGAAGARALVGALGAALQGAAAASSASSAAAAAAAAAGAEGPVASREGSVTGASSSYLSSALRLFATPPRQGQQQQQQRGGTGQEAQGQGEVTPIVSRSPSVHVSGLGIMFGYGGSQGQGAVEAGRQPGTEASGSEGRDEEEGGAGEEGRQGVGAIVGAVAAAAQRDASPEREVQLQYESLRFGL